MNEKTLILPHDVYIILTSKCNLRCIHCYGNYGVSIPKDELSGDEWCKVIKDLSDNNVFYVNISGGEPTCHEDFDKIVDCLIENEMHYVLTTNGLFGESTLKKIIESKNYLLGIKISLDGPDFESHGYIRRNIKGDISKITFDKTIDTIKKLKENNIGFNIGTCLHSENIEKINEMQELIFELKPVSWYISTISSSGRADENQAIFVSESDKPKKFWSNLKKDCSKKNIPVVYVDMPNLIKSEDNKDVYFQCPAARWFCEINSDGLVTPCPLARTSIPKEILKFDKITSRSIKDIWSSYQFNTFRKWQHSGCDGCLASGKCDRCVPQSIQWFNDPLLPPPYCIANSKNLKINNHEKLKELLKDKLKEKERTKYIEEID